MHKNVRKIVKEVEAQGYGVELTPKPPPKLVYKTAYKGHAQVVRAVVGDRLMIFYFVNKGGVWFLLSVKPAISLPS